MMTFSSKYAGNWHRLKLNGPTFFSSYYEDLENPVEDDHHASVDCKVVGTLITWDAYRKEFEEEPRRDDRVEFGLVIRRVFIDDWAEDDNYNDIRSEVLFRKWNGSVPNYGSRLCLRRNT